MNSEMAKEFEALTVDWSEIRKLRSPKQVIERFEKAYGQWVAFCIKQEDACQAEYKRKLADLEMDVRNHPDYQAMQKRVNELELMYREARDQKERAQRRIEEQDGELRELRNRKKAGRPALASEIVDRIAELRGQGLSIRKIAEVLQAEGYQVKPATVGKYV